MMRSSIILFIAMLCSGCTMLYTEVGRPISTESMALNAGTTHCEEVLDNLGPPCRISALQDGYAFIYEYLVFREMQFGLSGPAELSWLALLKLTLADVNLRHDTLMLHFGSDGYLISAAHTERWDDVGMGASVQPLLALKSVVDTSDYEDDSIDAADWGASLLEPLPVTLNLAQNLNTGAAGLEQSGTAAKVGQHTLEMR